MARFVAAFVMVAVCGLSALDQGATQPPPTAGQPPKEKVDHLGDPLPVGAFARLGTTRYRHGGMDLLGFTPDGKSLMYLGSGALHTMDISTGKVGKVTQVGEIQPRGIRRFDRDTSMAFSGDAKVLAIASGDGSGLSSISVIEMATGKERRRFNTAELFNNARQVYQAQVALSENGKWLVISSPEGAALPLVWVDTETGQRLHEIAPEKDFRFGYCQFSRDGRHLVAIELGDMGKGPGVIRLRVVDAARGISIRSLEVPANTFFATFELCHDGKSLVAYNSQGGPARLYDYSEGKELKEVRAFSDPLPMSTVALSRDGKQLFVQGQGKVHQWDIETGKEIRQIEVASKQVVDGPIGFPYGRASIKSLALSPNGKQLAFWGAQSVQVFDTATGKQQAGGSPSVAVGAVRFTPDGRGVVVSNADADVKMWDARTAKFTRNFARFEKAGERPSFALDFMFTLCAGQLAFSADGKLLAVASADSGVGVWNANTGATVKWYGPDLEKEEKTNTQPLPTAYAFAPRGSTLAVATPGGGVKLWDSATGQALRSWSWFKPPAVADGPDDAALLSLAFSPDGKTLAGGAVFDTRDGLPRMAIILWESATGKERLRISPANKMGMFGTDGFEIEMLSVITDQLALSLAFSPDGKQLMMGTFNGFYLLDAATGKDVVCFSGRNLVGRTATFSADGKLLFIGRWDGMVRILDAATARVLRDVPAHDEAVLSLAISPDGKMLASGSYDSTVLLWDIDELTRPQAAAKPLAANDREKLWDDLADGDASKAYQAISGLAAWPAETVPLIKARLHAVPPADPKLLAKLFEDLNSQKFATREKASFELEKLGDLAGSMLRQQLAAKPALEMRQRMEKLMAKLNAPVQTPQTLQAMRAIEVLERIGTAEALEVLTMLAKGAPGHRITEDARDGMQRVQRQLKAQQPRAK